MQINLRKKNFILFIISVGMFFLFRFPYRTHIYTHNIWDFHIADTSPNFFVILMFGFLKKWRNPSMNNYLICSGALLGIIIYEYFIQTHIYQATIDHFDVLASLIGALVFVIISNSLERKKKKIKLCSTISKSE